MAKAQAEPSRTTAGRRLGFVADGVVKVVLALAYVVAATSLGHLLGVAAWLMVVAGVLLLVGGATEIGYVRARPVRTYTRFLAGYDTGWVLATLAALLLEWRGSSAAGDVWIVYQAVAAAALAALLAAGVGRDEAPSRG